VTEPFILFAIAAVVSFIGSIPMGPISALVIHTSLNRDHRSALLLALGGCIPEIFYCYGAFIIANIFVRYPALENIGIIATGILVTAMGISIIRSKPPHVDAEVKKTKGHFWKGFATAAFNPMLITFWLAVVTYSHSVLKFNAASQVNRISFTIGCFAGAFLFQLLLARIALRYKERLLEKHIHRINLGIGTLLISLGAYQFIRLIFETGFLF
jgi:threonine/homoserine/homoserine lactone efflux protein